MFCANNFESVKVASIDKKLWCKGLFWNSSFCFFLFPPFFQVSDQFYFLIYFDKISSFAFLESMFPALVRPVSYHHSFSSIAAHLPFLCCLYTFALQVRQTESVMYLFFSWNTWLFSRSLNFPPVFCVLTYSESGEFLFLRGAFEYAIILCPVVTVWVFAC